jgi:hypothetical protein
MYRTSEDSYQNYGFSSNESFLNTLINLAQAPETEIFPTEFFTKGKDTPIADEESGGIFASSLPSYNTFSPQADAVNSDSNSNSNSNSSGDPAGQGALYMPPPPPGNRLGRTELTARVGAVEAGTDEDACIICYTNRGDVCLMNCGHGGICFDCASTVVTKRSRQCPVCRGEIKQIVHVNPLFFWLKKGAGIFYSDTSYTVVEESVHDSDNDTE